MLDAPYKVMSGFERKMEKAFNLEDEQEKVEKISDVVESIKKYFNPSSKHDPQDKSLYGPYSSFLKAIGYFLDKINGFINEENEENDGDNEPLFYMN